jgi:phosphoribosyl 1,2-cyclic phosphodiesterase
VRFAVLGSGSRGNGMVIEVGATLVLLDCGFSVTQVKMRLANLGKRPEDLSAIVVTHEHSDHVSGVAALARSFNIAVWATPGTAQAAGLGELAGCRLFDCHAPFAIGDVEAAPFPVPHDAREPSQFIFGDGARRVGVLTDVGSLTPHIAECLNGCDALVLECNHDMALLAAGDYPPSLKQRVGGRHGHLNNDQAAELLGRLGTGKLQHLVAAHLSEKNNRPRLAQQALAAVLGCEADWIAVADQEQGLAWREIM